MSQRGSWTIDATSIGAKAEGSAFGMTWSRLSSVRERMSDCPMSELKTRVTLSFSRIGRCLKGQGRFWTGCGLKTIAAMDRFLESRGFAAFERQVWRILPHRRIYPSHERELSASAIAAFAQVRFVPHIGPNWLTQFSHNFRPVPSEFKHPRKMERVRHPASRRPKNSQTLRRISGPAWGFCCNARRGRRLRRLGKAGGTRDPGRRCIQGAIAPTG